MTTLAFSFPQLTLDNGYFAVKYSAAGWTIYHKDQPNKAVWNTIEPGEARRWARENQRNRDIVVTSAIKDPVTNPEGYYRPVTRYEEISREEAQQLITETRRYKESSLDCYQNCRNMLCRVYTLNNVPHSIVTGDEETRLKYARENMPTGLRF